MELLISLVSAEECAGMGEVYPDYLDVKNPADGSLGMADIGTISSIRLATPTGIPVSAAIGDADNDAGKFSARALMAAEAGADIVKVGLRGFSSPREAEGFLASVRESVERRYQSVKLVAAIYADITPEWMEFFPEMAKRAGIDGCLVDTYRKDGKGLFDHIPIQPLCGFTEKCRKLGVLSAVAGSLSAEDIPSLEKVKPGIAGFRAAVSANGRDKTGIDPEKLKNLILRAGKKRGDKG